MIFVFKALNDDLPSTLTVHQVAETRSSHDRPVDANMATIVEFESLLDF